MWARESVCRIHVHPHIRCVWVRVAVDTCVCNHTRVYLCTWSASIFLCARVEQVLTLRLVPTVPFFSSGFSVALFSHRPGFLQRHQKQKEKKKNTLFQTFFKKSLAFVLSCQISRWVLEMPWWRLHWHLLQFWVVHFGFRKAKFPKLKTRRRTLNASFPRHMTHPTYCT